MTGLFARTGPSDISYFSRKQRALSPAYSLFFTFSSLDISRLVAGRLRQREPPPRHVRHAAWAGSARWCGVRGRSRRRRLRTARTGVDAVRTSWAPPLISM